MSALKYRPDIDGMRTIAVGAVLIYHAKFATGSGAFLPGGFLGVDVFFVISGFLITSLILREWQLTGTFSISDFYERRARRLLPALFAVIFVTIPAAWFILMPSEMVEFVHSVIASVFFVSNMFWYGSVLEYGAGPGLEKPFLHTWSLAVEEQFYMLFPWLYVMVLRRFTAQVVLIGGACVIVGLIGTELMTRINPTLSFYWVFSRLWELLAGGVLAHKLAQDPEFGRRRKRALQILPWIGLILILAPFFRSGLLRAHPGFVTVPTVLGTVILIWFASPSHPVTRLLSSKIFVGIGLISYSLYLWHYPVFAMGRLLDPMVKAPEKVIWLLLAFVLAFACYWLVERPFRTRGNVSRRALLGSILAGVAVVSVFAATMMEQDGRRERFPELIALYGSAEFDNRALQQASWDVLGDLAAAKGFGPSEARFASKYEADHLWFDPDLHGHKVLVLGNSHAKDMFNVFHLNPDLFEDMQFARFGMKADLSEEQIEILLRAPNFEAADVVLVAFSTTTRTVRRMDRLLAAITNQNKEVIILLNSPAFRRVKGRWTFDWSIRQKGKLDPDAIEALAYQQLDRPLNARMDAQLSTLAKEYGLKQLARADYICDEATQTCDMVTPEGRKAIFDRHHYSVDGARYFGRKIHDMGWLDLR